MMIYIRQRMKIQLFISFLLFINIHAQQNLCLCSCCSGNSCTPTSLPNINLSSCTLVSCLEQCRLRYTQCQGNYPNGYLEAQCISTAVPQYNCRCDCCNAGSPLCTPSYVGDSMAYSCLIGSCSISCKEQYPDQCRADQNGITQGTCISSVTTSTTTTTTTALISWLGNTCACSCTQTGSCCSSTYVGITSASYCSSAACTLACQNQYLSSSSCSSVSTINQINGTCISYNGGKTFCDCRCCTTNTCINYRINTNEDCNMCNSICRQYSPCSSTAQVIVQTCSINNAKTFLPSIFFILIIVIFTISSYI